MTTLPPRGPALDGTSWLLSFDVDCGELVPGHRFVARGLQDDGTVEHDGVTCPAFSLEYELVPGVPPESGRPDIWAFLVGIDYTADVALPWEPSDGGAIAPFEGGPSTHGTRGSWPLPEGANRLTFAISGIDPGARFPRAEPDGALVVDLAAGRAHWNGAAEGVRH